MLQRLFSIQLPEWAQASHPHVRYELGQTAIGGRRGKYVRAIGFALAVVVLYVGGYLVGTNFLQNSPGQNLTESAMAVLFWPTFVLQLVLQFLAMVMTINTVTEQKRRLAWDNLRATEVGTGLVLRARWAAIYYRLRLLLGLVLLVRIALILGILYDLTGFQGRYIDLLVINITPEISPIVGALLMAFLMTAALLIPLTSIGLDAAVGLFIAVNIQQRVYNVMTQVIFLGMRIGLALALTIGATQFINGLLNVPDVNAWLLMGGYAAFGDWGLKFLHTGFYSEVWATIPYAVFFGVALLIFSLLQSILTEGILSFTIRRAERIG
ncbi:MAG: hypothetical protein R3E39_27410 [Anaerolineae bacterium]